MYTEYTYVPPPVRHETKWHFGWNSCLLFITSLVLLALYTVVPAVSLRLVLASITVIARGPVGAEQLTTYKYVVHGNGQVRP